MTMKTFRVVTGLAFLMLLTGCTITVYPVITESEAIFDARLPGNWKEIDGSDQMTVSRSTGNSYEIEYTSEGKTGRFAARLGYLGDHMVLDVWPKPRQGDVPDPYAPLMLAGHLQLFPEFSDNEISLAIINPDALLSALQSGKVRLPYRHSTEVTANTDDEGLVLTGTTDELRKSLGTYCANPAVSERDWLHVRRTSGSSFQPVNVPCFEASAWREADQLFRCDPHWLGADVASTVDLGNNRTLWLFGDTWIDASGKGTRKGARMISNSVAIQTGTDPTTADISFFWGTDAGGNPDAMFPDRDGESLWFGNGIRVGDRLVLFFARTIWNTGVGLGFEHVGWTAIMVSNPDAEPSSWQVQELETPENSLGILVGFAAVLKSEGYVVALGSQNPVKSHPIFAARWPEDEIRRGNLLHPEWWAGEMVGWVPDSSGIQRYPLFNGGQTELTIHYDDPSKRYICVQTEGFGAADIMMRAAPSLTGPWSDLRLLYRPPEYYRENVSIYSGKAHPSLTGSDLVLTYATNTFRFEEQLTDSLIYYPRFVRLTRCR